MTKTLKKYVLLLVVAAAFVSLSCAQAFAEAPASTQAENPGQAQKPGSASLTALKVEIVISRYEGSSSALKKTSSLPYELTVISNDKTANLRMGGQIPVTAKDGASQYFDIGTNIDCSARTLDDGRFKLDITIEDRSAIERKGTDSQPAGMPVLRNFRTNNVVILRDGQSTQFTAATDKTSGEVVKVDVTLKVEK